MRFRGETSSGQQPKTKKTLLALALGFLALGTSTLTGIVDASATASCVVSGVTNNAGTVTFEIHYSDNTAGCAWTVPAGVTSIEAAVVGGGGSGGWGNQGGGGGGGEVLYNPSYSVTPNSALAVTIGTGGVAPVTINRAGGNGASTTFGSITALGGGGGGGSGPYWASTAGMSAAGGPGGSSGGNNIFGTATALNGTGRATYGVVTNSSYSGWTSYAHHGGAGVSNPVQYGYQVQWGAGAGGGGAYEAASDSTAVANGSGGMITTLGRSGAGIYLMGHCLGGGGEGTTRAPYLSNTLAFAYYTTANPCKNPDGSVATGTSSGGYHGSASVMYAAANSGGGTAAATLSGSNDSPAGANGNIIVSYVVPTPAITSASITNVQKPIISGTGVDGNTISVSVAGASYTATVASGAWSVNLNTATPVSGTLALNVNGTNTVTASATNADGGVSSNVTQTLTIDTTAPATPTLPSVPTLTNLNNRQINFSTEAGSSPQCSFDSGTYAACTSPYSTGTLADGSHTIRVKTVDAAGNVSGIGTYTWTLDTTPPNQPNIATTAAYQTTKSPTITFSADAGTSLSCRMDTNVATTCTSSTTMVYSNLTEGSHIFTVYSADTAGNASSRSYAFSVDTVIPNVPVISTSGAFQTISSLSLVFTSDVTAGTQCSIDGGAYSTCTSPYSTGTLAEGSHTFQVRGLDAAGNTSSAASYSWTQDTIAPAAPSISNSAAYVTTTSASITFTASAGTTTCSIDNATYTSCTSPLSTGTLDEGSHTVRIKTADTAGNVSSIASYTWIQDSIAPATPVIANSGAYATTTGISVTFTADVAATTQCSLDGGTFSTCNSPYATGTLAEGSHSIRVKSTDSAGNISSIATYNWTQDTIAPTAPTISNTAQYIRQTYVTISYIRSVGTTTCQLDTNAPTTCSNTTVHYLTQLSEGSHTIRIATADAAGNTSSASYSFTVDTIAPAVAVFDTLPSITNSSTSSLGFTTEVGVSVTCSLDGAAFASCASPFQTGSLADGNHSLAVRSTDVAGNISGTQTHTWSIDTVTPVAPAIANHDPYQTSNSVTINFTSETGTSLACQLDEGAPANCSNSTSFSLNQLSEGAHTFTISSTDLASNRSSSSYTFTVDTIAPTTAVISNNALFSTTNSVSVIFTADAGFTTCSLDNDTFTTCSSPLLVNQLGEGSHSVRIKTSDAAGNVSNTATYNWTQDTIAPAAALISNTATFVTNSNLTISFTNSEGSISCQLDSVAETSCSSGSSMTYSSLSEGAHTFTIYNSDQAGNRNSSTYSFTVDTVAPIAPTKATENAGPVERTSSNAATFNFAVPSGATAQCRLETTQSGAFDWTTCTSGTSLSSLTLGTYRFSVRSVDAAGNLSTPITYDWEVVPPGPAAPGITFSGNVVTLSGAATGANGDRYEAKIVDGNDNIVSPWGTVTASFALRQSNGTYRVYARLVDDNETIGTVASLGVTVTEQPAPAVGSTPRATISSNSGYSNQSNLGVTIDWPVGTKSVRVMSTQNSNNGNGTTSSLATGWVSANGHRGKNWNFTPAGVPTVTATHQLTVEFLDAAGAVINTQVSSVIIDVQAPTLTSAIPTAIDGSSLPIQVSATDESGGSGLGGIVVTRTVASVASAASVSAAALVEQEYSIVNGYVTIPNVTLGETMTVRVKDRAGNLSDTSYTVAALNRQTLSPVAKFTGTAKVGQTLKASPGVWPTTHVVTYQWLADGVNIAGATKNSYKLTNAEAGKRITVAVTGTRATYYPVVVTAPASAAVIGGTLTPGTPTLSGTTTVGQTLTATAGNWVNNPTLTYAWKRGTTTVGTGLTYTLTNLDAGQKLTFTVTAAKTGFTTVVKTLTTAMITGGTITEQSVTISSAVVAGKKVFTANTAAWSPSGVALTYQWLKNGTPIAKATAKTYTATPADLGQNLSVTVTGKKTGFTTRIVTSLETLVQ